MKGKLLTAGATLLTLALVGVMAAAPAWWFGRRDAALFSQPVERVRLTGRLSPEGEDLYMVRTLHARDSLRHQDGTAGYVQQEDAGEGQSRALLALDDMAKAGAVPPALRSLLQQQLAQEGGQWRYAIDGAGFEQVQCLLPQGSTFAYFGMELEPRTRFVVRLWVSVAQGAETPQALTELDVDACLAAYRQWLGLQELDDWETLEPVNGMVRQRSQKGLLQLYAGDAGGFEMGTATLTAVEE